MVILISWIFEFGLVCCIRHLRRQKPIKVAIKICGGWTRLAVGARLRQLWHVQSDNFSDAALVVLGHGTTLNDQSAAPVFQHAAELRRREIFAEVREAFWKQEPHVKKVLAEISAPRMFIVPFFISDGYFSTEIIPQELGFPSVPSTINHQPSTWFYCRPVGSHDLMTKVILARADEVVKQFPFPRAPKPADTTLLIAGHGTSRNANSRKAVERQVELIRAHEPLCGSPARYSWRKHLLSRAAMRR